MLKLIYHVCHHVLHVNIVLLYVPYTLHCRNYGKAKVMSASSICLSGLHNMAEYRTIGPRNVLRSAKKAG